MISTPSPTTCDFAIDAGAEERERQFELAFGIEEQPLSQAGDLLDPGQIGVGFVVQARLQVRAISHQRQPVERGAVEIRHEDYRVVTPAVRGQEAHHLR